MAHALARYPVRTVNTTPQALCVVDPFVHGLRRPRLATDTTDEVGVVGSLTQLPTLVAVGEPCLGLPHGGDFNDHVALGAPLDLNSACRNWHHGRRGNSCFLSLGGDPPKKVRSYLERYPSDRTLAVPVPVSAVYAVLIELPHTAGNQLSRSDREVREMSLSGGLLK